VLAQNPGCFNSILGFRASRTNIFHSKASQVNGIHVPFTLSIHKPTQYQNMLTFGHNGAISMDVTFGMNDVKYHLFTLMGFNAHHRIIPLAWVITSWQTVDDLVEWLKVLKVKILTIMPNWKPSCFIIDDTFQELWALQWIRILHEYLFLLHKTWLCQALWMLKICGCNEWI
jgi:hypothetical protein